MDRRTFLGTGAAALASLTAPRLLAQACGIPITEDRYGYGPYYLADAPERTVLAAADEPGQRLAISGTVRDCGGPVAGATLEVWHATSTGCYIHRSQPECDDGGNPNVTRLWATLVSDAQGRFAFDTIKPGVYLNGNAYRPSHIHFRIRSPLSALAPVDVVTQLYFQGDPYIAGDYGADEPGAKARTIALAKVDAQAPLRGVFDVILPGGSAGLGGRNREPLSDPALGDFDALVQRIGDRFRIFLPPLPSGQPVEVRLYEGSGRLVLRSRQAGAPVELDASHWPRGAYSAEMRWQTDKGPRMESIALRK
jgi:protocatechuate 3,4-dioxygenase, beta subunit